MWDMTAAPRHTPGCTFCSSREKALGQVEPWGGKMALVSCCQKTQITVWGRQKGPWKELGVSRLWRHLVVVNTQGSKPRPREHASGERKRETSEGTRWVQQTVDRNYTWRKGFVWTQGGQKIFLNPFFISILSYESSSKLPLYLTK